MAITCMLDSDWAADRDSRKSISAFCLKLGGCLFSWSSKKQSIVALSSTKAEYAAATSAARDVMHMRNMLESLGYKHKIPANMRCDNQSAIAIAKNLVAHARTRHFEVKQHFIRKAIEDKVIDMEYIRTDENDAE